MSLILCRQEQVEHPYFIENLGIHIYSPQELCYVIYHHPLMALEGFLNMHLVEFIRDELGMGFAALKLENWLKSGENPDDALMMFLQECDYYHTAELNKFRQSVHALRKLPATEYAKQKADDFFRYKQYGKAITGYESLLEEDAGHHRGDCLFWSGVWNNLGAAYARVFQFDKALLAFEQSYHLKKDKKTLEKIYDLTLLNPSLVLKDRYQTAITEEYRQEWRKTYQTAEKDAETSDELKKIDDLFQQDPIKRMEGAEKMIQNWKQEYRSMA